MVAEISNECRMPLWVAAVDFQKAFDSVLHTGIWQALADQEVPMTYAHMLSVGACDACLLETRTEVQLHYQRRSVSKCATQRDKHLVLTGLR